jgi:hypothetical protein
MKKLIGFLIVGLWLGLMVACSGSGGNNDSAGNDSSSSSSSSVAETPTAEAEIDPETGLLINPNPAPQEGEFIVIGPLSAVNVIPQDKPLFTVKIPGGASYTINSQPIPDIYVEDGSQIRPHEFRAGMQVRATVRIDPERVGGSSGFVTEDLTILLEEE